MSIQVKGVEKRIGLALSGGGYRAAAFHLGVMQQLQALGLLDKLDLLSCVSGGSIAGATVALNWGRADKLDLLAQFLSTKSIAVSSVLGGVLDPFSSRILKLAESYDTHLYGKQKLSALSGGPRIYLNATNLATGNLFFFVAGGGKPTEMGEHEMGVVMADGFPISQAVAASSAFPPVFPPLRLDANVYAPAATTEYVTLSDGGVYDNMGVNPVLRDRNALDYVIVSDGGKPFAIDNRPTESGAIVLKEGLDIMMEQIRGLEFDRLQHRYLAGKGPKPMWFSIDSRIGEAQPGDAAFASVIGTNLAKLSAEEMTVLTRHGGALVKARISLYAPELLGP
ncbi:patatin [Pseudomonas knackmussii B13]|uniref:Patatin n=1 Tax=Pseudomonas knackmussii (strain DSM 6978 / CCUG 54928 / LMG 23759 / B13) TaxID=1301098 RepID=A0A024HIJ1_PSEKB|nr:patatin-like phospholipase family protein [Pseudomonas knackmussii]CDF84268.1 patatin [Pseudomonas knackmussii B13]